MSDDAFHLTALDVRRYDFGNALRGYDRTRVDQFREQVAAELERFEDVRVRGEDRVWASGNVTIDRSDFAATADSLELNTGPAGEGTPVGRLGLTICRACARLLDHG